MLLMSCKIKHSLLTFFPLLSLQPSILFCSYSPYFPGGHSLSCCVLSESSYYNRKRLLFARRLQTERQKTARNKWEGEEKKNFRKPTKGNEDLIFVAPIFFLVCNVTTMMVTEYNALQRKQCLSRNFFQICVSDVFFSKQGQ